MAKCAAHTLLEHPSAKGCWGGEVLPSPLPDMLSIYIWGVLFFVCLAVGTPAFACVRMHTLVSVSVSISIYMPNR